MQIQVKDAGDRPYHLIDMHGSKSFAFPAWSQVLQLISAAGRALKPWLLASCLLGLSAAAQAPLDLRLALVIGNSAYPGSPLANPANDARAMATTLRGLGFMVIELQDASKTQMSQGITRIGETLKGKQAVAMLYYAGHGLQLDWRNFMLPVEARIGSAADIPAQAVDLNSVIDAFKAAGTRMNILVLDACRDNPFGSIASGKGLAPMDAPTGTFLAYATAPGNVAEDGDVKTGNGLYTQFLLQELKKPTARIEDVFKRVRLQVRQKSEGRQIPWESTSLEDDFVFNDGTRTAMRAADLERLAIEARNREQQLQKQAAEAREREARIAQELERQQQRLAEAQRLAQADERRKAEEDARERERQLKLAQEQERQRMAQAAKALEDEKRIEETRLKVLERAKQQTATAAPARARTEKDTEQAFATEKADWDRIADSTKVDDFYTFLLKYPNGKISEVAQAQIERLQKSKIAAAPGKDGIVQVAGAARYRLGDSMITVVRDGSTGVEKERARTRVTRVDGSVVEINGGGGVLTPEGATIRNRYIANMNPPRLDLPAGEYAVGKKWTFRNIETNRSGAVYWVEGEVKIAAIEDITVPAGTFKTFKLELESISQTGTRVRLTRWYEPDWGFSIKMLREIRPRSGTVEREVHEMVERQRGKG